MPQLLLEFFSEEIPARMQKRAEEDLARLLREKLDAAGLSGEEKTFSTPQRLAIVVDGLAARTPDVCEERKGPRVGAPAAALQGFLRGAGLSAIEQAKVQSDAKGDFYVALIEKPGRATADVLKDIVPEIVRGFPWPKSMRSGESDLAWVRPLQNILCVFAGEEIRIEIDSVPSKAETRGHRFHAPAAFKVEGFEDYAAKLRAARVVLDREERKAAILREAKKLCEARGLSLVEDAGLLEEVAGLVEWPVALLGEMDPAFLDLPSEIIRLAMRTHQKYFAVRDAAGELAPHFVVVANIEAKDGGKAIAAGNARVLSARLNDARFFWDVDRFYDPIEKTKPKPLDAPERVEKLKQIVFHQKLGSVWDKVERVEALAKELCSVTGADPGLVERAARLAKMDLVTETVGEFPELQGQIGRLLYLQEKALVTRKLHEAQAETPRRSPPPAASRLASPIEGEAGASSSGVASIAAAIEDHYRPLGPNDRVPTDPVAVTLALADKLDTLVGFWAIDEKPTGSSDPYALRRAALGFVRTVLENDVRFTQTRPSPLAGEGRVGGASSADSRRGADTPSPNPSPQGGGGRVASLLDVIDRHDDRFAPRSRVDETHLFPPRLKQRSKSSHWQTSDDLLAFLAERLKVQLREQGKRHDLVDAVFAPNPNTGAVDDDLVRIAARVEALDQFLRTEAGANLLSNYRRSANILRAEERKDDKLSTVLQSGEYPRADLFQENAEKTLYAALEKAAPGARAAVAAEDFTAAMAALAGLRAPVDAFFDDVLVNAEDPKLRYNRLALLTRVRDALHEVADFSKIEG